MCRIARKFRKNETIFNERLHLNEIEQGCGSKASSWRFDDYKEDPFLNTRQEIGEGWRKAHAMRSLHMFTVSIDLIKYR